MKYLILLFPLIAYSQKCPKDIDAGLSSCKEISCIRDDSKMLNIVFGVKEIFVTNISVKKRGSDCVVEYKSDWTGSQTCKFPLKYLKQMSSIMGDSNSTEALSMFVVMTKLSKAKSKKEFDAAQKQMSSFQNKMMAKQIEVKKFMDENKEIASRLNTFCKLDESSGKTEKLKKYKNYMKRISDSMVKIQQKIQKKMLQFSK